MFQLVAIGGLLLIIIIIGEIIMLSVSSFAANRPFRPFADRTCQEKFDRSTVFNKDTNVYEHIRVSSLPPTIIRYHNGSFEKTFSRENQGNIEAGKNWQTLSLVSSAFSKFGLGEPPASYEDLTDNHIALAIFMNKMNASNGRTIPVVNPKYASITPEIEGEVPFLVFMGHNQYVFGELNFKMANLASQYVSAASFFQPNHIEHIVHEISKIVGDGVDKDALRDTVTNIGNQQKEQLNERLAKNFEVLAQAETEQTYKLFSPDYDITDSPNFAQYKQALIQLMEDMFTKAVSIFLFGDTSQNTNHLWDDVWTDDRIFNIAGQNFTMREMDDRRTFLWSGSHRINEGEAYTANETKGRPEYAAESPEEAPKTPLNEILSAMLAQRFSIPQKIQTMLADYEKFFNYVAE